MSTRGRLEACWASAAADLGLELVSPFCLGLPSGKQVSARLLLKGFGADHGMLIVSDYSSVSSVVDEITSAGYGFSVLDDPTEAEAYDRDGIVELLTDWGWSGDPEARPSWLAKEESRPLFEE